MKLTLTVLVLLTVASLLVLTPSAVDAAKKKKKKGKKKEKDLFNSATLKCLVCQSMTDEFLSAVYRVDPKKVIDTGTFRVDGKGNQKRTVIPFARSQVHLMELVDKVCDAFDDYAQGTWKSNGEPAVVRLTTPLGNMNPDFAKVDVVPDEDLNTKLKFHCQSIVEDNEESLTDLLSDEDNDAGLKEEICVKRAKLCKTVGPSKKKDEL